MTAMHPDSGVPWTEARNSIASDIEQSLANCNELWYSTSRCQPRFDPAAANAVLAELINTINAGEVVYDCGKLDQVQLSIKYLIQRGIPRGGVLTGGSQTYNVELDPPATRINNYMTLTVIPNVNNGGFSILHVNGLASHPIVRNDGYQLKPNDMLAGIPLEIIHFNGKWFVVGPVASQTKFPDEVRFTSPGPFTWTAPEGVSEFIADAYGGGGGGGTGQGDKVGGAGGGGAGYARKKIFCSPGQVYTGYIANGGRGGGSLSAYPGISENGQTGEMTTFANQVGASGGGGGEAGVDPIPGTPASSVGGIGIGDYILRGSYGSSGASGGSTTGQYTGYGGLGGSSPGPEGGRPGAMSTGSSGPGIGFGAGGSGGGSGVNAGVFTVGGKGADGAIVIYHKG